MKSKSIYSYLFLLRVALFCLSYFALNKHLIDTVTSFSRNTFNQYFCRWRCFLVYWFGKREFGKFTNGIPVIGVPSRPPPPPPFPPLEKLLWTAASNTHLINTKLQYSLQLADTAGTKKLSADWRCPHFGKFFNIGLNFENKAFFYIYNV